ncbi:unnamed protein product [Gongylonema pulchrum]|uniref:Uncharacterized protein n=1 Tax=Gongylonema pulchrum TaxID=637853 RepID=A0A183E922_9BILA|nr:unnamed protein product [Gongylonema pulchrum]
MAPRCSEKQRRSFVTTPDFLDCDTPALTGPCLLLPQVCMFDRGGVALVSVESGFRHKGGAHAAPMRRELPEIDCIPAAARKRISRRHDPKTLFASHLAKDDHNSAPRVAATPLGCNSRMEEVVNNENDVIFVYSCKKTTTSRGANNARSNTAFLEKIHILQASGYMIAPEAVKLAAFLITAIIKEGTERTHWLLNLWKKGQHLERGANEAAAERVDGKNVLFSGAR